MSYCGQGLLVKHHADQQSAKVLRCRSWKCPDCNPDRCKRLVAEAIGGAPTTFITLTLRADDERSNEQKAKALSQAWRLIRLRAMRRYKVTKLPFLAVVESTKAGTPHLHILARVKWIDQRWLSRQADELLNAPIVDIRRIDAHRGIAKYVAKYVGKAPTQFGTSKRYWKSQDYETRADWRTKRAREPGTYYRRVMVTLEAWCASYEALGYEVQRTKGGGATAAPPALSLWQRFAPFVLVPPVPP